MQQKSEWRKKLRNTTTERQTEKEFNKTAKVENKMQQKSEGTKNLRNKTTERQTEKDLK
jgi:hypothetical protein